MPTPSPRWRAPIALVALALLFACLKGRTPTEAGANDVRFDLHAQVSGGSVLHVTVVYLDQSTSDVLVPVTLLDQRLQVAVGSQSLPLTIDLTRCLADPQHVSGTTCELFAGVVLEQNGQEVDSVGVGPVVVTPGQIVHDTTSLVAVGHIDVFPTSASLTVGAITVLKDSVFSPTNVYLPNTTVRWTSADSNIAKVNQSGAVTGVSAGATTVTASTGGQTSNAATITVSSSGGGGLTFPGLGTVGNTVTFSATAGGPLPVAGYVPVASTSSTTVSNLTATITPSSATAWLAANVSDTVFGARVTHRPPGINAQQIRRQTQGSSADTTPATVDVHPTTTSLSAGTYSATVTVTGSGGASASFSVVYTITAATPVLSFSPSTVAFNQYAYGSATAAEQTAFAINSGSGGTIGTIAESGPVLYTGPDTGWLNILGVGPDTVALQPKSTFLKLGTDTAKMRFTATGATNPDTLIATLYTAVTYQKVVLGAAFGCGLTTASTVYCWGGSGLGELGDGGPDLAVRVPVRANLPYSSANPVIDIEAGLAHACALLQSGTVFCWGSNANGQVGAGSAATTIPNPTQLIGHTYGQISLGANHTCAIEGTPPLAAAAYVDCWGDNSTGAFGNNLPTATPQTTPLITYNSFYTISAGDGYTCGINAKTNGTLYCWGANGFGQLGNGYSGSFYSAPQQVTLAITAGPPPVPASVTTGTQTTCAIDVAGNGYCWGDNTYGQVGNGTMTTPVTSPTAITGSYSWTSISAGLTSVCGIASTGQYCWGDQNYGQLGNGTTSNTGNALPGQVLGGGAGVLFTEFTVGEASQSACYITGGAVSCFGFDSNGQLGDGGVVTAPNSNTAVPMTDQPAPAGVGPTRVIQRRPGLTRSSTVTRSSAVPRSH